MKLDIWVLPGNHKYRPLIPLYCQKVQAVLLTFAFNDLDSFNEIVNLESIFDKATSKSSTPVKKYLIGLKSDLYLVERVVTWEMYN